MCMMCYKVEVYECKGFSIMHVSYVIETHVETHVEPLLHDLLRVNGNEEQKRRRL